MTSAGVVDGEGLELGEEIRQAFARRRRQRLGRPPRFLAPVVSRELAPFLEALVLGRLGLAVGRPLPPGLDRARRISVGEGLEGVQGNHQPALPITTR